MAVSRSFICILLLHLGINEWGFCDAKLQQSSSEEKPFNFAKQKVKHQGNDTVTDTVTDSDQAINFRNFRFNEDHQKRNSEDHGLIVDLIPPPKLNVTEYSRISKISRKNEVEDSPVEKTSPWAKHTPLSSPELNSGDKMTVVLSRKNRDVENSRSSRLRKPYQRVATPATLEHLPSPPQYDENKGTKNRKNKTGKGGRSRKQGGRKKTTVLENGEESQKKVKNANNSDRKSRKKGESRNFPPPYVQEGKSSRRLRQHMQHKKKVKQFLQKRIQEQIDQRRLRRDLLIGMY